MRGLLVVVALLVAGACASSPARSSVKVPLEIPEPPPRVAMDPGARRRRRGACRSRAATRHACRKDRGAENAPGGDGRSRASAGGPDASGDRPGAAAHDSAAGATARSSGRQNADRGTSARSAGPNQTEARPDSAAQLNAGKRADYDSARRFLSQAEAAVKDNNLLLAESSVEKAETLADGLEMNRTLEDW